MDAVIRKKRRKYVSKRHEMRIMAFTSFTLGTCMSLVPARTKMNTESMNCPVEFMN